VRGTFGAEDTDGYSPDELLAVSHSPRGDVLILSSNQSEDDLARIIVSQRMVARTAALVQRVR
jgi:hypothetical protein